MRDCRWISLLDVNMLTTDDLANVDVCEIDYVRREIELPAGRLAFVYGDPFK